MNIIKTAIALFACLLLSSQVAANELEYAVYNVDYTVSNPVRLENTINSPARILGKSILILIPASDHTTSSNKFQQDTTPIARFTGMVKDQIRAPVRTLLNGEYRAGADRYTQGTVYQADWSDKGIKLGIKYQF